MYNTPRAATIISKQEGALWGLVSVCERILTFINICLFIILFVRMKVRICYYLVDSESLCIREGESVTVTYSTTQWVVKLDSLQCDFIDLQTERASTHRLAN